MSNSESDSTVTVRHAPIALDRCSLARTSDLVGDRWSLLILREAFYGVTRFENIRADISVPKAVLSQRLLRLVEAGILVRRPYQESGARKRYEYVLSEKGRSLGLLLIALMQWGDENLRSDPPPLEIVDAESGEPLRIALTTTDGEVRDVRSARIVLRNG